MDVVTGIAQSPGQCLFSQVFCQLPCSASVKYFAFASFFQVLGVLQRAILCSVKLLGWLPAPLAETQFRDCGFYWPCLAGHLGRQLCKHFSLYRLFGNALDE